MKDINYDKLPEGLRYGMKIYLESGIRPGGFMTAVLTNNLFDAIGKADLENQAKIVEIVKWVYNEAPMDCWGSVDKMNAWIDQGGFNRRKKIIVGEVS